MRGCHYLRSWSSTQRTIALSSGEAELTALVKCSCELIGMLQLAADWDDELEGEVYTDSTAALGVVARKGAGKLRHVRVGQLWVQEKADNGEIRYRKVRGESNIADILTKPLAVADIKKFMHMASMVALEGRADSALDMAGDF